VLLQALLRAEWDATNTAEVMRAKAEAPGEHTIAGEQQQQQQPPHLASSAGAK
jgi:hypothetical protein